MGRPPIYPWDDWFQKLNVEGQPLHLTRGVDFEVGPSSFRGGLLNEAKRRGVRVRTIQGGTPMRETLHVIPVTRSSYPWDKWLDGSEWVIQQGRDFVLTRDDMVRSLRRTARARGLAITAQTRGDQILFRAVPKGSVKRRPPGYKFIDAQVAIERRIANEADEGAAYEAYLEMTDTNALQSGTVRSDSES